MNTAISPTVANASKASRATGAIFLIVFGGLWLALWAQQTFDSPVGRYIIIGIATLAYFAVALRLYVNNRTALKLHAKTPENRRRSRKFRVINVAQWVSVVVVGNVLANIGLLQWVIPAVILIIGVHFIPLAKLFSYPPHYVTGAVLVVLSIGYPLIAAGGAESSVGCLCTASFYGLARRGHSYVRSRRVLPNPRFERTRSIWLRRAVISFSARRSQMQRAAQPKR